MSAVTFADIFNSSSLEVIAPHASFDIPTSVAVDSAVGRDWLARLLEPGTDRAVAFFDEELDFLLLHRIPKSALDLTPADELDNKPPAVLLAYLVRLQVAYDVSYIPSVLTAPTQLQIPPRTSSLTPGPGGADSLQNGPFPPSQSGRGATHPSIFPPNTPNPVPGSTGADKRYVQTQGTPVRTGVWGERNPGARDAGGRKKGGKKVDEDREAITLLWDSELQEWVAVFRMNVLVPFMPLRIVDPLLALTVSITLREKPLPVTPPRRALVALLEAADGSQGPTSPIATNGANPEDIILSGPKEVNLLEGLRGDPTFSSIPLNLPSTRLGPSTRRNAFGLAPRSPTSPASALTPHPTSITLRRSFRKVLRTLAGIHVRMHTAFVPHVLLPPTNPMGKKIRKSALDHPPATTASMEDEDDEEAARRAREQREAGSEEHTVVLCIEVENAFTSDDDGSGVSTEAPQDSFGFTIDRAEIVVSGEDSRTTLVGWGETLIVDPECDEGMFPLRLAPREQLNLLYAVSFLRGPEAEDSGLVVPSNKPRRGIELSDTQREVQIILYGRPSDAPSGGADVSGESDSVSDSFPARSYTSRWRCTLDLSPKRVPFSSRDSISTINRPSSPTAMPTPATPFPMSPAPIPRGQGLLSIGQAIPPAMPSLTSRSGTSSSSTPAPAIAGSKRFSATALMSPVDGWRRPPVDYTSPTSLLNPANAVAATSGSYTPTAASNPLLQLSVPGTRTSYFPPSMMMQQAQVRSPTTYAPPPNPFTHPLAPYAPVSPFNLRTPVLDISPASPGPYSPGGEPPRTPAYPAYPSTPGISGPPTPIGLPQNVSTGVVGVTVDPRRERQGPVTPGPRVGGFPVGPGYDDEQTSTPEEPIVISVRLLPNDSKRKAKGNPFAAEEIFPLDKFTLDIFVFNRSSWTRRFEVSYSDEKERRTRGAAKASGERGPGFVPLESRVRIGPLLPGTCQSVRMDFLALSPGVHTLETLIMRDVHTGYSMKLRPVTDVVIHEPIGVDKIEDLKEVSL
ncbi:hypothetical protein CERSUDRAFT_98362 [Gelatoporia subvermispora B]|uniref:Trafficking protein particle complex II-specific subunit 65 IgD3 domain-containing protein n=1 Tax=Ceriporiopsis subvermispora (strain B) TaxID=914234 RepID=M2QNT0_CERS8|nr:hypothetical protein CERSUDRAFT_98362 [Gelatoporia subvermispora B]